MLVTYTIPEGLPLTDEQKRELEALKDRPIVYDEDCPELTPETERALLNAAIQRNWMKRRAEDRKATV